MLKVTHFLEDKEERKTRVRTRKYGGVFDFS